MITYISEDLILPFCRPMSVWRNAHMIMITTAQTAYVVTLFCLRQMYTTASRCRVLLFIVFNLSFNIFYVHVAYNAQPNKAEENKNRVKEGNVIFVNTFFFLIKNINK